MRQFFSIVFILALIIYVYTKKEKAPPLAKIKPQSSQTHRNVSTQPIELIKKKAPQKKSVPQKIVEDDTSIANDPCLIKLSAENAEKIEQFKEKFLTDPNNPLGRWVYDSKSLVAPTLTKNSLDSLYRGLYASNLLLGRENAKPNLDYAAQSLWESFEMDPKNAEPLFYLALLEKERNNLDEAKRILQLINDEHLRFQSSLTKIYQNVYSHAESPADMLGALDIFSELPIANISKIGKLLLEMEQNHLGSLLMSEGLDESRFIPDLDYDQLAYAVGRSAHVRLPSNVDSAVPSLMQLQEVKQIHPQWVWLAKQSDELDKNCKLENLESVFRFYKMRGTSLSH
jgi:hypothetical protein